jgi:endonuclease IV
MTTQTNFAVAAWTTNTMHPSKSAWPLTTAPAANALSRHILPHGSYLVNLAQEDKAKATQAYNSFLDDLRRCEALGITLYNFQ